MRNKKVREYIGITALKRDINDRFWARHSVIWGLMPSEEFSVVQVITQKVPSNVTICRDTFFISERINGKQCKPCN